MESRADGLVPMRFAICPLHLSKVLRLSRKIIWANLKIWCYKMQPFWGNQRPDLLTSLMNMSLVLRLPREMHLSRSSSMQPHLNLQKWSEHVVLLTFWLGNVLGATTARTFSTSQLPKLLRTLCALRILTSKCASRHNGMHFFDISTSKSGPNVRWSLHSTVWLPNVLRATTARNFSSLI